MEQGGLRGRGFFQIGAGICTALSGRLSARFPEYFGSGGKLKGAQPDKEVAIDTVVKDQAGFWMSVLTTVSTTTGTPLTDVQKMDVFDFFSLLGVVERRNKTK